MTQEELDALEDTLHGIAGDVIEAKYSADMGELPEELADTVRDIITDAYYNICGLIDELPEADENE